MAGVGARVVSWADATEDEIPGSCAGGPMYMPGRTFGPMYIPGRTFIREATEDTDQIPRVAPFWGPWAVIASVPQSAVLHMLCFRCARNFFETSVRIHGCNPNKTIVHARIHMKVIREAMWQGSVALFGGVPYHLRCLGRAWRQTVIDSAVANSDGIYVFNLQRSIAVHFSSNGVVWIMRSQLAFLLFTHGRRSIAYVYEPHHYLPLSKPRRFINMLHLSDRYVRESILSVMCFDDARVALPSLFW